MTRSLYDPTVEELSWRSINDLTKVKLPIGDFQTVDVAGRGSRGKITIDGIARATESRVVLAPQHGFQSYDEGKPLFGTRFFDDTDPAQFADWFLTQVINVNYIRVAMRGCIMFSDSLIESGSAYDQTQNGAGPFMYWDSSQVKYVSQPPSDSNARELIYVISVENGTVMAEILGWPPPAMDVRDATTQRVAPNGVDDTEALIEAAASLQNGGQLELVYGIYRVTDTILIPHDNISFVGAGIGVSVISVANGWANKPVVLVRGSHCRVADLSIVEDNASAIDAAKNGAFNIGLDIKGDWVTVNNIRVDGFGFPLTIRDELADASADHPLIKESEFLHGYSWGVELDSVHNARFVNCVSHDNGLDGFKAQNEYDRTCDGLSYENCHAYNNGLRDIAAGGAENTNGNGFDLYHGGWRTRLSSCRAYLNYGSGLNIKGGDVADHVQGELVCVNSQFTHALTVNTGGGTHGVEIGTGYANGNNLLQFIGVNCSNNDGHGAAIFGGFASKWTNCNFVDNAQHGVSAEKARDVDLVSCNFFRNRNTGLSIGVSNDGTFLSKRVNADHCTFSGTYDPFLAAGVDPRTAISQNVVFTATASTDTLNATAHPFVNGDVVRVKAYSASGTLPTGLTTSVSRWVVNAAANTFQLSATRGGAAVNFTTDGTGTMYATTDGELAIRTYSDSADVTIRNSSFMNFWSYGGNVLTYSQRTIIDACKFYNAERVAIYVVLGDCKINHTEIRDMDWTSSTADGAIHVATTADIRNTTFFQTSLTASTRAILFDAGATNVRWENLDVTNFTRDVTFTAGATTDPDWVQQDAGTAAPTGTGRYFITGAIRFNSAPASAQPEFWRCTTGGEVGTWSAGPNHP